MATLNVGSGGQFATIAAAVAASHDGDVLAVQAGTYTNDFSEINKAITLRAVGGTVKMVATASPPNGKSILVTRNDVTIDGFEFSGTRVPDGNGAGIRFEGGNLTVLNSNFHHNENGILAGAYPDGTISIRNSEFGHNGAGDGRTHNIYIGDIKQLTIDDSYFHDAVVGHEIKSRARTTIIRDSRIQNEDGSGSYEVDLPNGGRAVLTGNVIEQGAGSQNPAIVHYGGEGEAWPGSSLEIAGNTVINHLSSPSQRLLLNQTGVTAQVTGNEVFGLNAGQIAIGPAMVTGTTYLSSAPPLDTSPPWADDGGAGTPGNDLVRLDLPMVGEVIDLGGGTDRLVLSSAGPNTLTASHVEIIIGGKAADAVTLAEPLRGGNINLGGGADQLVLSGGGANSLKVSHVETIIGGAAADTVKLGAAAANDLVSLGAGADTLRLFAGAPNTVRVQEVEKVFGGREADSVTVIGNQAVQANGAAGNDTLTGGGGADRLTGDAGADVLTGGAGADRFIYRATADSRGGAQDHITDFQAGVDDLVFVGLKQGNFAYRGGQAFSGGGNSEARLAGSVVQVDVNGDGSTDMSIDLSGGQLAGLSAKDFIWS